MERKNSNRDSCQCGASEANRRITQFSSAPRQPQSAPVDLAFMPPGGEMASFFLCLIAAGLACLPTSLDSVKGGKEIKRSKPLTASICY